MLDYRGPDKYIYLALLALLSAKDSHGFSFKKKKKKGAAVLQETFETK